MKAIQINSTITLTSGLTNPAGGVCVIAEGYADVKSQKDGEIPAQIATLVYASLQAYIEGKTPLQGIADFNTVLSGLNLSVSDYEALTAETLLINTVFDALAKIYSEDNLQQITISSKT